MRKLTISQYGRLSAAFVYYLDGANRTTGSVWTLLLLLLADGSSLSYCQQLSASNGLRSAVPYVQIAGDPVAGQFSVNDRGRSPALLPTVRITASTATEWTNADAMEATSSTWSSRILHFDVDIHATTGRRHLGFLPHRPPVNTASSGELLMCGGRWWRSAIIDDGIAAAAAAAAAAGSILIHQ